MKYSEAFILLGLLFASVVLVSSTGQADQTTSKDEKKVAGTQEAKPVEEAKQHCGCCYRLGYYSCGPRCCWRPELDDQGQEVTDEAVQIDGSVEPNGYGYGGGGYGGRGGYGGGGYGGRGGYGGGGYGGRGGYGGGGGYGGRGGYGGGGWGRGGGGGGGN